MKSIESGSQDWIFFQVEADRRFGQYAMFLHEFENRQILQWNSPNLARFRHQMRRIEVEIPPLCRGNQTIQETLIFIVMMTSSNGNIFRVTGPLCGDFTGPGEFPTQRPATRSFDVFFDLRLNKRLSKQPWGWWFETPPLSLRRQCNVKYTCSRKWPLIKITPWHMFIYIFVFTFVTVRLNLTESTLVSMVTFSVDAATQKQISLPTIKGLTKDYLCRGSEFFIFFVKLMASTGYLLDLVVTPQKERSRREAWYKLCHHWLR